MLPQIALRHKEIEDLFKLIDTVQRSHAVPFSTTAEIAARLTHLTCVRISGFVEKAMEDIFYTYATQRSGASPLASYVAKTVNRGRNLRHEPLCQLLGRFDKDWEKSLRAFISDDRKAALNGVVDGRNKIAHGESVGFGTVQLRDWFRYVTEVVEFIENLTGV